MAILRHLRVALRTGLFLARHLGHDMLAYLTFDDHANRDYLGLKCRSCQRGIIVLLKRRGGRVQAAA